MDNLLAIFPDDNIWKGWLQSLFPVYSQIYNLRSGSNTDKFEKLEDKFMELWVNKFDQDLLTVSTEEEKDNDTYEKDKVIYTEYMKSITLNI